MNDLYHEVTANGEISPYHRVHVESESLNKEFVGEKFHIMFWRDEGLICNAFNLGGMVKKGAVNTMSFGGAIVYQWKT